MLRRTRVKPEPVKPELGDGEVARTFITERQPAIDIEKFERNVGLADIAQPDRRLF